MKYKLLLSAFLFQLTLNAKHLSFDGSDDFVSNSNTIINQPSSLSVSGWFKATSTSNGEDYIIHNGNGGEVKVVLENGNLTSRFKTTSGWLNSQSVSVTNNVWNHFVATFENNSATKLYLNGSESGNNSIGNVTLFSFPGNLNFGKSNNGDGNLFTGQIDEVAIWTDVLSAAEVTALYNSGTPLSAITNSGDYTSSGNLAGFWNFN